MQANLLVLTHPCTHWLHLFMYFPVIYGVPIPKTSRCGAISLNVTPTSCGPPLPYIKYARERVKLFTYVLFGSNPG